MAFKFLQAALLEPEGPPRRLSTELNELLKETAGRTVTLGELEEILKGRGHAVFLLLMALPFAIPLPMPIPGLSVPFGIVIMLLGLRIAFGMKPSLPGFIRRREVSRAVLEKIVGYGLKLATKMEKLVKPRMHFLQRWPGMINLIGLGIASGGFLLSLPLPPIIPFSNTIPAISVLLLTAGLMERDGLLVLFGYVVNIGSWIYFGIMFHLAGSGVAHLWDKYGW